MRNFFAYFHKWLNAALSAAFAVFTKHCQCIARVVIGEKSAKPTMHLESAVIGAPACFGRARLACNGHA